MILFWEHKCFYITMKYMHVVCFGPCIAIVLYTMKFHMHHLKKEVWNAYESDTTTTDPSNTKNYLPYTFKLDAGHHPFLSYRTASPQKWAASTRGKRRWCLRAWRRWRWALHKRCSRFTDAGLSTNKLVRRHYTHTLKVSSSLIDVVQLRICVCEGLVEQTTCKPWKFKMIILSFTSQWWCFSSAVTKLPSSNSRDE